MKNAFKLGFAALVLSVTIAACGDGDKSKTVTDSSSVKIDTASSTKIDTAGGTDTTTKKTSTKTTTTETKKN